MKNRNNKGYFSVFGGKSEAAMRLNAQAACMFVLAPRVAGEQRNKSAWTSMDGAPALAKVECKTAKMGDVKASLHFLLHLRQWALISCLGTTAQNV